jgi:hypothetical protein
VLLELLAAVMIGMAVAKASVHLGDYLAKGWAGDVQGGAQSLAKGLAAGAVELIFAVLTYITAGAFRALAAAAKGAGRVLGAAGRGAARLARVGAAGLARCYAAPRAWAGGSAAWRAPRVAVVRGRLVFRGARRGFARGVRSLDELAERLAARFRGFSITRRGFLLQLWGHFNPRVLLANAGIRTIRSSTRRVGQRTRAGGRAAIVVGRGRGSNQFVRQLERNARRAGGAAENRDFFKRLWDAVDDAARRRIIYNRASTAQLRRGIPGPKAPPLYQAHHVAPRELLGNARLRGFFKRIGFNIEDGLHNGVMLPPVASARTGIWSNAAVHLGSHPNCTRRMVAEIGRIEARYARAVAQAGGNQARAAAAG